MLDAMGVLPAGPGGPEDDFPLHDRLRLRDTFCLHELRMRSPPFQALEKGPWSVFIAIAVHWQRNVEAWPSQEALARFCGCSTRAVRSHVATLERADVVRLRRERRADGSERIYYRAGGTLRRELAVFVEQFPRGVGTTATHPPETNAAGLPSPPEAVSAGPPETVAVELRDQDQNKFCSSGCGPDRCQRREDRAHAEQEEPIEVTSEDRALARLALQHRMARKHPKRPPPRWFDRADVEMVARCSAALGGDAESKLAAHRQAIDGAFRASREGPPTSRFIWGKLEHFLEHIERGRCLPVKALPAPAPDRGPEHGSSPSPDVLASLSRLFGPAWRARPPSGAGTIPEGSPANHGPRVAGNG